jgi:hypothetical protein
MQPEVLASPEHAAAGIKDVILPQLDVIEVNAEGNSRALSCVLLVFVLLFGWLSIPWWPAASQCSESLICPGHSPGQQPGSSQPRRPKSGRLPARSASRVKPRFA